MKKMEPATFDATRCEADEWMLLGIILNNIGLIAEYGDALSEADFADDSLQNLYVILQNYYALYGKEEITDEHLAFTASKLI